MKVLITANSSWYIHNFFREVVGALIERKCVVTIVAPFDDRTMFLQDMGCDCVDLKMNPKGKNPFQEIVTFCLLFYTILRVRPNGLISFTIKNNLYGTMAARFLKVPIIPTISGVGDLFSKKSVLLSLLTPLLRFFFRPLPRLVFMNKRDQDVFLSLEITRAESIFEISSAGVDLKYFSMRLMPPAPPFRFIMCGRLLTTKGVNEFVGAARILRSEGIPAEFVLVGFSDWRDPASIHSDDIDRWVAEGIVRFEGETHDVRPYLASCHCVVLPTYYPEGVPRSLLEGAAMGRILIASKMPGCDELINEGVNGFFCETKDALALANVCKKVVTLSQKELSVMGFCGRDMISRGYDMAEVIKGYLHEVDKQFED